MECTLASSYASESAPKSPKGGLSSSKPVGANSKSDKSKCGLHVGFHEKGEVKERREKFLTAKYGSHQMNLIRKRLAVEMWLYEELQKICAAVKFTREIEVDVDELLDMDNDEGRRRHLHGLMPDLMETSPDAVKKFADDLLEKIKTL